MPFLLIKERRRFTEHLKKLGDSFRFFENVSYFWCIGVLVYW
jgi:hypothetical protein